MVINYVFRGHRLYLAISLLVLQVVGLPEVCRLQVDWSGVAAKPHRTNPKDRIIGCQPCNYNGKYEVHILQVYEWAVLPLEVNVVARRDTVLYLVLVNVRPTHWLLRIPGNVVLGGARVLNLADLEKNRNFYNQIILENGEILNSFVARQHYYMIPQPGVVLGENLDEMVEYVTQELGFITSYTAIDKTSGWNLTVGTCQRKAGLNDVPRKPDRQSWKQIDGDRKWCNLLSGGNITGTPLDYKSFTQYSCSPCNTDGKHEIHVINMYRQSQDWSADVIVEVYTKRKDSLISLVLINRDAMNWIVRLATYWWIDVIEIHLLAVNTSGSSVTLETAKDFHPYIVEKKMSVPELDDVSTVEDYCYQHFGFLSSYNAIQQARKWRLDVGTCLPAYVEPEEDKNSPNYSTGFPLYFIPVIVIPLIFFLSLCIVPTVIDQRLKKSKKRREAPLVVTLNDLRRQTGLDRTSYRSSDVDPSSRVEAEVYQPGRSEPRDPHYSGVYQPGGSEPRAPHYSGVYQPGGSEPRDPHYSGVYRPGGSEPRTPHYSGVYQPGGSEPRAPHHSDPGWNVANPDAPTHHEAHFPPDRAEGAGPPSYDNLDSIPASREVSARNDSHDNETEAPPSYDVAVYNLSVDLNNSDRASPTRIETSI